MLSHPEETYSTEVMFLYYFQEQKQKMSANDKIIKTNITIQNWGKVQVCLTDNTHMYVFAVCHLYNLHMSVQSVFSTCMIKQLNKNKKPKAWQTSEK